MPIIQLLKKFLLKYSWLKCHHEKYLLKNTGRIGDLYVYSLFLNALVFFADRFNLGSLTKSRVLFFHKWAYSLRLKMQAVYQETINNYALGYSDRINEHLNIFESVSQMTEDRELDSIVLNTIKLDELNNKNNKTNDKGSC